MQPLLQWKTMSITQTVCEFVASDIQHIICRHHIVICDLPHSTVLFHIISWTAWFAKKVTEYKMCVLSFSIIFV